MRFWMAGAALIAIVQSDIAMAADFTAQQRAEIVQIVREALKKDPSILRDAIEALQSNESERQAAATRETISANHDALYKQSDPTGGGCPARCHDRRVSRSALSVLPPRGVGDGEPVAA